MTRLSQPPSEIEYLADDPVPDLPAALRWLAAEPRELPPDGIVRVGKSVWPWPTFQTLRDRGWLKFYPGRAGYVLGLLTQTGLDQLGKEKIT